MRALGWTRKIVLASAGAVLGIAIGVAGVASAEERDPRDAPAPDNVAEAVKKVLQFDKEGKKPAKSYKVAYLTECVTNLYCEARLKGLQDAASKYGFTFKVFDPNFNPQAQLKHVQNAVEEGFDAYLFAPTADAPGCKMWKDFLVPTGKPVVSLDLTMCGDVDYTPGLAATVTMQRQPYFDLHWENALAHVCKGRDVCKVVSLSGFTGSDLFARWEKAIDGAAKNYPGVKLVSRREAKFDPRLARQITQDTLQVNRDLALIVAHDDDMTQGALAAVKAAGLVPGKDVKIYSMGANSRGLKQVEEGAFDESTVLDPYDEAYYASVALIMALEGAPVNGYVNEAQLPRVTEGPGTILITKENQGKFKSNW
jgi:galactofuranose transport system substrate-binding protein